MTQRRREESFDFASWSRMSLARILFPIECRRVIQIPPSALTGPVLANVLRGLGLHHLFPLHPSPLSSSLSSSYSYLYFTILQERLMIQSKAFTLEVMLGHWSVFVVGQLLYRWPSIPRMGLC